jgi:hypothetical protein
VYRGESDRFFFIFDRAPDNAFTRVLRLMKLVFLGM